jgi:hypothetical protein
MVKFIIYYFSEYGKGVVRVAVPYWWDRSLGSLQASIYETKPSVFTEKLKSLPIPQKLNKFE